jgi:hypothetical protein
MSPSVSVQLRPEQPPAPVVAAIANSNAQERTRKPRRKAVKNPLPPREAMSLSQKIQAADEHWQELIEAYNKNQVEGSKGNELRMLAAFSCFVHAIFDNKDLCGQVLIDFVTQLGKEKPRSTSIFS